MSTWANNLNGLSVGDTGYLVASTPAGRSTTMSVHRHVPTTNMSGEPRSRGWLGNTNNVHREARGPVTVIALSHDGDRARVAEVRPVCASQIAMLAHLDSLGGEAPSIMALARADYAGRGHRASYDRLHRLAACGLVELRKGIGPAVRVVLSDYGRAALEAAR